MNTTPQPALPSLRQNWRMYRTLVGIGTICGLIIVSIFQVTKPVIAHNKAVALEQAIFRVLPEAQKKLTFRYTVESNFELVRIDTPLEDQQPQLHVAYNQNKTLIGFAITGNGMGFQDNIELIYGYKPDMNAIVGYRVLSSRETPGLGTRIETDETFLKNFERLDVSLDDNKSQLAHQIEAVKPGKKTHPWQIDTISGATISSKAVTRILNESASNWIPLINKHMQVFIDGDQT